MASFGVWVRGHGLALAFGLALTGMPASSTMAQERAPDLRKPSDATGQLLPGPSLYETGRVANSAVSDPGVSIERRRDFASPNEASVRVYAVPGDVQVTGSTRPAAAVDPVSLEREIRTHFASLPACRVEVARLNQVSPRQVVASELLLRWTVLSNGSVTDTNVIATAPTDAGVMDCVKQRMNGWTFSPLAGAAAEVQRVMVFPR